MNETINKAVQSGKQAANDLSQITKDILTDGCSLVPEFNMHECCNEHDLNYRVISKWTADWKLLQCGWKKANTYTKVYKRTSTRFLSFCFYIGVTIGGWIPYFKAQKNI